MVPLPKYATISVPREVKKRLEAAKGLREWGEYLTELYEQRTLLKRKRAFDEAAKLLTPDDLSSMKRSSKAFREKFSLR